MADLWKHIVDIFSVLGINNVKPSLKLIVVGYKPLVCEYLPFNYLITLIGFSIYKCMCVELGTTRKLDRFTVFRFELSQRIALLSKMGISNKFLEDFNSHVMNI